MYDEVQNLSFFFFIFLSVPDKVPICQIVRSAIPNYQVIMPICHKNKTSSIVVMKYGELQRPIQSPSKVAGNATYYVI